jgi:TIR domain
VEDRKAVFISHASPEDNAFALWLGAKLAAVGYEVWADVLRLSGGDDWQRKLERALRERTVKFLLAANPVSVQKQGVRNEIQIASDVGKKLTDSEFIIPLKLAPFEAPFLIAHAQYIDFECGWARGLQELLTTFQEKYHVPRDDTPNACMWRDIQLINANRIAPIPEDLVSNWLEVRRVPERLFFYPHGTPRALGSPFASVSFGEGFLSCDELDAPGRISINLKRALKSGWRRMKMTADETRKKFANLANQSLDRFLESKGLRSREMANRQPAWWAGKGISDKRISFRWTGATGSRQLQGFSGKRKIYWHFGISPSFRSVPILHVRLKPRLIFTEDRETALSSHARAHRLRRSFAKGWRNARWRDMLLALLFHLSDGSTLIDLPLGARESFVLTIPPLTFKSPVSVSELTSRADEDPDDPDVEFDDSEETDEEE